MSTVFIDSYGSVIEMGDDVMKKVSSKAGKSGKSAVISNPMKGKKGVC